MKEFARSIVEDPAVIESTLDVEASQVGWLTCVEVGREDVPWRADGEG